MEQSVSAYINIVGKYIHNPYRTPGEFTNCFVGPELRMVLQPYLGACAVLQFRLGASDQSTFSLGCCPAALAAARVAEATLFTSSRALMLCRGRYKNQ